MSDIYQHLTDEIQKIREAGLYKHERIIKTPQTTAIEVEPEQHVINFCANNYLGLADHPALIDAAIKTAKEYGFGMASVRFICGTQTIHKELEESVSKFLETEDTILYSSCFDANGGLFETLLTAEDAIISDALNHASIIDGIRLCKAKRFRYKNNDMQDLEKQLIAADAQGARFKMIATDGVFSMDGILANLQAICDLADKYNALVMVDDSHAVGFMGRMVEALLSIVELRIALIYILELLVRRLVVVLEVTHPDARRLLNGYAIVRGHIYFQTQFVLLL